MRSHFDRACLSLTYALGSQAATWSLGFREEGCVRRTASLSRDFQAAAGLVSADALCYLVLFVGDLWLRGRSGGGRTADARAWSTMRCGFSAEPGLATRAMPEPLCATLRGFRVVSSQKMF